MNKNTKLTLRAQSARLANHPQGIRVGEYQTAQKVGQMLPSRCYSKYQPSYRTMIGWDDQH